MDAEHVEQGIGTELTSAQALAQLTNALENTWLPGSVGWMGQVGLPPQLDKALATAHQTLSRSPSAGRTPPTTLAALASTPPAAQSRMRSPLPMPLPSPTPPLSPTQPAAQLVMDSQEERETLEELLKKVAEQDPEYAQSARKKFRHTGPYDRSTEPAGGQAGGAARQQ